MIEKNTNNIVDFKVMLGDSMNLMLNCYGSQIIKLMPDEMPVMMGLSLLERNQESELLKMVKDKVLELIK